MIKEMGKGKKIFMVLFMLIIFIVIVVYLLRKVSERKEEADRRRAKENEERHAESAIFEEQENKQLHELEADEQHMVNDLKVYNDYINYSPVYTWNKYLVKKQLTKTKPLIYSSDTTNNTEVELIMYYQSFIKLFRVIVVSIRYLDCFKTKDSMSLKFKMLLNRNNGEREIEKSLTYELQNDIIIDEKFSFDMNEHDFKNTLLYLSIWSIDVFHQELLLGALSINLSDYDCSIKQSIIEHVLPVKQDFNVYGYLLISLCHVPASERLICVILSGREIKEELDTLSILNKAISPFVKVCLVNNGKLIKKHKLNVAIESPDPLYNEMIDFYIPEYQVKTSDLLFYIIHKDSHNTKKPIGKITLGSHASGGCYEHWMQALSNPDKSVARWHPITR